MGSFQVCCCYFTTFFFISVVLFVMMQAYLVSFRKMESLQEDVKEIFRELSDISRKWQGVKSAKGGCKPPGLCSSQDLESVVQRYTNPLKTEIMETKRMVEQASGVSCASRKQGKTEIMRTDFALESLGAKIESVNDEPYGAPNFIFSVIGLGTLSNAPRNVLNPSMQPGNCYAFKGYRSTMVIKLMGYVFVDSVGIEHITDSESPDGTISSAPKDFSVYGLAKKMDIDAFYFGSFTYDAFANKPAQIFNFDRLSVESYKYLKLQFESNNGHPNFTCIYRITVHGKLDKSSKEDSCDV